MPKENTHLLIADKVFKAIKDKKIKSIIENNLDYYYLGSITPDTFHYKKSTEHISRDLHGELGNPTNTIILKILSKTSSDKDLAFAFGYLSHCAADRIMHKFIVNYAGDHNDKVEGKEAIYKHYMIETFIDKELNDSIFLDKVVKNKISSLMFAEIISSRYKVSKRAISSALRLQIISNKVFRNNTAFNIVYLLASAGAIDKKYAALLHGILKKEKIKGASKIKKQASEGINKSVSLSLKMIKAAYAYNKKKISKKECIKTIIPGPLV